MLDLKDLIQHWQMCCALGYKVDLYRLIARIAYGVPYEHVTRAQRQRSKTLTYFYMYGA